jgi:hypothetical protein
VPSSLILTFRQQFPEGSILSELLTINDGLYVVKVSITVRGISLSQALAANSTLELAEDIACNRALERLALESTHVQGPVSEPSFAGGSDAVPQPAPPEPLTQPAEETPASPKSIQAPKLESGSAVFSGKESLTPEPDPVAPVPDVFPLNNGTTATSLVPSKAKAGEYPKLTLAIPPTPPKTEVEPAIQAEDVQPSPRELSPDLGPISADPIDLSDIIAQTDVELQRLGWDIHQGREFLEKTYGKRSRHDLTDEELLEFLLHLESQPTP